VVTCAAALLLRQGETPHGKIERTLKLGAETAPKLTVSPDKKPTSRKCLVAGGLHQKVPKPNRFSPLPSRTSARFGSHALWFDGHYSEGRGDPPSGFSANSLDFLAVSPRMHG
jgi:hypothetical protein